MIPNSFRFPGLPTPILQFRPLLRLVEGAVEAGVIVGTEAAKFQMTTGIAGQTGIGGGPWSPEYIPYELRQLASGLF